MSKSELKRLYTQDPAGMAKKIERMEIALKVIYTWSKYDEVDTDDIHELCAEALGIDT